MIWLAILGLALNASPAAEASMAAAPAQVEEIGLRQLLSITRVYVDRLTGGETAAQFRDILISSLDGAKLFVLTENQDRADVILRGAAEDLVFTDVHTASDSVNAHANLSTGRTTGASRGRDRRDRRRRKRIGPLHGAPARGHRRRASD